MIGKIRGRRGGGRQREVVLDLGLEEYHQYHLSRTPVVKICEEKNVFAI